MREKHLVWQLCELRKWYQRNQCKMKTIQFQNARQSGLSAFPASLMGNGFEPIGLRYRLTVRVVIEALMSSKERHYQNFKRSKKELFCGDKPSSLRRNIGCCIQSEVRLLTALAFSFLRLCSTPWISGRISLSTCLFSSTSLLLHFSHIIPTSNVVLAVDELCADREYLGRVSAICGDTIKR